MKIAVFGVGAVGGYFGGKLTQTNHEVIFIARGDHLQAIRENGLQVVSENGTFVAQPALATDNPSDVGEVDLLLVATKTWQIEEAAAAMRPMLTDSTVVLPLLNGVEAPQQLEHLLGTGIVLGGFCRVQSQIIAPGKIKQGGTSAYIALGAMRGGQQYHTQVAAMKSVLDETGAIVEVPHSIEAAMWQKLLFVSSLGGVGAVTRMPAGILRKLPETRTMLQAAMREIYEVAIAQKLPMAGDAVAIGMGIVDRLPQAATASMQRDLMNGRPSELEAQNGVVVRFGAQFGIETPTHRFVYHSMLPSEKQARGELNLSW